MVKVKISGDESFSKFIKSIPRGMKIIAMRVIANHFVEGETSALRKEPAYKYFKFADIYGGWFSKKQQGYVMAMIKQGKITPGVSRRSHEIRDGWETAESGDWRRVTLTNSAPGVEWVKGDAQARMMKEIGWTPATRDVQGGLANAMREAQMEVNARLQEKAIGGTSDFGL